MDVGVVRSLAGRLLEHGHDALRGRGRRRVGDVSKLFLARQPLSRVPESLALVEFVRVAHRERQKDIGVSRVCLVRLAHRRDGLLVVVVFRLNSAEMVPRLAIFLILTHPRLGGENRFGQHASFR